MGGLYQRIIQQSIRHEVQCGSYQDGNGIVKPDIFRFFTLSATSLNHESVKKVTEVRSDMAQIAHEEAGL